MHDTIRVLPNHLLATIQLHANTALADCTTIEEHGNGHALVRNWPGLSSGEELLWSVAAWLNDAGQRPSWDSLRDGLDVMNLAAITILFDDEGLHDPDFAIRLATEMARDNHRDGAA